jgi:hypothetical protein
MNMQHDELIALMAATIYAGTPPGLTEQEMAATRAVAQADRIWQAVINRKHAGSANTPGAA